MENSKKVSRTYVGKGTKAPNYDIVNFSVCIDSIEEHIWTNEENGKRYIKLSIAGLKETDKYGKTHTVFVNDFKPESKNSVETTDAKPNSKAVAPVDPAEDAPF